MSQPSSPNPQRLEELLADRALAGLTPDEASELETLLAGSSDADASSLERAAATLDLALFESDNGPLPAHLVAKIQADAAAHVGSPRGAGRETAAEAEGPAVAGRIGALPWLLTAASIAVAVFAWLPAATPSFDSQREMLVANAPDALQISWAQNMDNPASAAHRAGFTGGDVVWSDAEQRGFMRFTGLRVNDPSVEQYQLWIFDRSRSAERPVDGGVFDITRDGEVIVPIDAKLPVDEAFLFAITVERPGGVVVSDRSSLPLLAQAPDGAG